MFAVEKELGERLRYKYGLIKRERLNVMIKVRLSWPHAEVVSSS